MKAVSGATAGLQRRTNLIWWKETLYSPSARVSYRSMIGVCFTLIGILGIWSGGENIGWPSVPGTILQSERIGMGDHQSSTIVAEFKVGPYWYHLRP